MRLRSWQVNGDMSKEEATVEMASDEEVSEPGVMAAVEEQDASSPVAVGPVLSLKKRAVVAIDMAVVVVVVAVAVVNGNTLDEVKVRDKEDAADEGV